MIDSVSVNLVPAGTSGRTTDRGLSKWASGMFLKTIGGEQGVKKHTVKVVCLCLVHSQRDRNWSTQLHTLYNIHTVIRLKTYCLTVHL